MSRATVNALIVIAILIAVAVLWHATVAPPPEPAPAGPVYTPPRVDTLYWMRARRNA
jgi:hypothetical protein